MSRAGALVAVLGAVLQATAWGCAAPSEATPTACREIVPAVVEYGKPTGGDSMYVECRGESSAADGTRLSRGDVERRCASEGCTLWVVEFDGKQQVVLRKVRLFPAAAPFSPRWVELRPTWGLRDGRPFISGVAEGART